MAQADSKNSTVAPVAPTRRRFLSQAAGVAAGGAALALATIPPAPASTLDPVFALIAEKRAADVTHCEAIDAEGEFDERDDRSSDAALEAQENSLAACHYVHEVDWKLATTPPTTLAGVAAVLRFANEIEDAGNEWPNTDTVGPDGWHYQLRATMAAAIEALTGKAVTS
jgi:hypothetical protein